MSTLYELTDEMVALDQLLEGTEGVITPELEAWMQEYGDQLMAKVDNVALYLLDREGRARAMEDQSAALEAKAKAERRKVDAIRRYVQLQMVKLNTRELAGNIYRFAMQRNGGRPPVEILVPVDQLPEDLVTVKTTVAPNMLAIREAIVAGKVAPEVARIAQPTETLRLR